MPTKTRSMRKPESESEADMEIRQPKEPDSDRIHSSNDPMRQHLLSAMWHHVRRLESLASELKRDVGPRQETDVELNDLRRHSAASLAGFSPSGADEDAEADDTDWETDNEDEGDEEDSEGEHVFTPPSVTTSSPNMSTSQESTGNDSGSTSGSNVMPARRIDNH